MNLRVAILAIGSLVWDRKCHRQKWRNERLRLCDRERVKAPIRYGRKSDSRGDTYTMVFSDRDSDKMGWGLAIPCVQKAQSTDDLVSEAEALWAAEQSKKTPAGPLSASWGCVGMIVTPNLPQKSDIICEWSQVVRSRPAYQQSLYACEKEPIIDKGGILDISWPKIGNKKYYDGADVLLATVNRSDPDDGPSPKEIAKAWKDDSKGNIRYFLENQEWEIATAEDEEIKNCLCPKESN